MISKSAPLALDVPELGQAYLPRKTFKPRKPIKIHFVPRYIETKQIVGVSQCS